MSQGPPNDGPFRPGDIVRSRRIGEQGEIRGFRHTARLGFRYVVEWETGPEGYSLVAPDELEIVSRESDDPGEQDRNGSVA